MHRVMQTRFGNPHGNCMEACIASLFEVPIEELPVLHDHKSGYWFAIEAWARKLGYMPLVCTFAERGAWMPKGTLCIVGGKSPRGDFDHAVVWQCGRHPYQGEMIHDPHPDGAGIVGDPKDYTFFVRTFGNGDADTVAADRGAEADHQAEGA